MNPALVLLLSCDAPRPERVAPELDPGAPTAARRNRSGYDRVLRDLFGTTKTPGRMFPEDESAFGFDVVGQALTTTAAHVDAWEVAAADVVDEMFGVDPEETVTSRVQAEGPGVEYSGQGEIVGASWATRQGSISSTVLLEDDGAFELRVRAQGQPVDGEMPRVELRIDEVFLAELEVTSSDTPGVLTHALVLADGAHRIELGLANPGRDAAGRYRTLGLDGFDLEGPLDPEGAPTPARDRFVPCDDIDRACASAAIARFETSAWRRPPAPADVDWALGVYDGAVALGEPPDAALALAFRAVLMAPDFLFQLEAAPARGDAWRRLDHHEVASRLARFLWSSVPDDALLARADAGRLDEGGVREEVRRMLADPRAEALVDDFAGQWLDLRGVATLAPDPDLFPDFDETLRGSMERQLTLTARDFLRGSTTLAELVDGSDAWLDARLAEHVGVPWTAASDAWVRVPLEGRPGILGTPGWLAVHAHGDRASAVQRGRWVLEDLLCSAPPPPPPDVMATVPFVPTGGSIREQEEAIRADEYCQACHASMDGIGFVLHGFDAIGAARVEDELGYPIEVGTALAADPDELAAWLVGESRLPTCVARQTLVYALGRPMEDLDDATVDAVTADFVRGGLRFDVLAEAIATSDAFLYRGRP